MADITVTQDDRELAVAIARPWASNSYEEFAIDMVERGYGDDVGIVRLIAAHRLAATAAERARGQKLADELWDSIDLLESFAKDPATYVWLVSSRKTLAEWEAGK